MPDKYPQFSDFAEEATLFEGDKKKIDETLNREILILAFKIRDSKQRKGTSYATIQFRMDNEDFVLFTGSTVIIDQLSKYKGNIPFYTTIKKIDRYYTFS